MTEFYLKSIAPWSPVILRGLLWVSIAMLTSFVDDVQLIIEKKFDPHGWGLAKLVLKTLLQGFITWRTFLDSTIARHEDKLKQEAKELGAGI